MDVNFALLFVQSSLILNEIIFMSIPPPPPTTTPTIPVATAKPGIFGTKIPSTVAFAVGILLFFLPFADLKCNGTSFANQTGLGFATGSEWHTSVGQSNDLFGSNDTKKITSTDKDDKDKKKAQMFALAALGLAALGLLLSFTGPKLGGATGLLTGLLSTAALIGLMIDIKSAVDKQATQPINNNTTDNFNLNFNDSVKMTVDFTPWFYIAVIAFLVAAFFSYRRMRASGKA